MSLNRALVEFYIQYKLSQRDCSAEHLGLGQRTHTERPERTQAERTQAERTQAERTGVARTEAEKGTEASRTEASRTDDGDSLDSRSNGSVNGGGPDSALRPDASSTVMDAVKEALRDSANEFELRFSRAFSDLHRQLHITPATAYHSFESVMDEVFRDGVNWGRVVGLFAFGGALCVECVDKEMSPLVGRIVDWMTVYLDDHIQEWIDAQGGWARFAEVYGHDAAAEGRRSEESFKKWLFAGMTLVTGVMVGSLLAHKRL
ncbi:bcl-2-like protein 1 [Eucyclogobius newberryi]|uniref:bcl-2-like protein 1 n=1 Tax=Eucyclogobius newberryi TaxID=166745 RepID=UPI003B5B2402